MSTFGSLPVIINVVVEYRKKLSTVTTSQCKRQYNAFNFVFTMKKETVIIAHPALESCGILKKSQI